MANRIKSVENKKNEDSNGAIIIEASIILPLFLFMFMMFYSVVNICLMEAKVQNALSKAAKQVSSISYLYSFSGLKDKNDDLLHSSQKTKAEVGDVIDSFSSLMQGVQGIENTASGSIETIQDAEGFGDLVTSKDKLLGDAKEIKNNVDKIKASGTKIKNYFQNAVKDPKTFVFSLLKVLASDGFEYLKNYLGSVIAQKLCEEYFVSDSDKEFFNKISFDKSLIFPEDTGEIILVAEYKVRILPYIPVKLYYTISQEAVTSGWLDGDGGEVTKNGAKIESHYKKINDGEWSKNPTERAKNIRKDQKEKLFQKGYKEVANDNNNLMYNEATNTVVVIGSSNYIYGKENVSDVTDEEIEESILNLMAKIPQTSSIKYKEKDENGNVKTKEVLVHEQDKQLTKEVYLVVPDDKGYSDRVETKAKELEEKWGVKVNVITGYGSYYAEE